MPEPADAFLVAVPTPFHTDENGQHHKADLSYIEAAAKAGIETIIIPRSNLQDVLIDEKYESMVTIRPVDSLDEVLQYALVGAEEKVSRLGPLWTSRGCLNTTGLLCD